MIVADDLCQVKITLVSFLCYPYLANASGIEYESDLECVLCMIGITMDIAVFYSPHQKEVVQSLTKAAEYTATGDQQYQAGELDQAKTSYEKAKALYDQVNDTVRAEEVQDKITEIKAEECFILADQFFADEEYEKALTEYEKAKTITATLEDDEMSTKIQIMIDTCNSYLQAENNFKEGTKLFREAEDILSYETRIKNYKKAKLWFEKAQTEYEALNDSEKTEECRTWMQKCDTRIDQLITERTDSIDEPAETPLVYYILGFIIAGAAICVIVLYWGLKPVSKPKIPQKPESKALKDLKYQLAAGEITVEEFEELKSALGE